MAVINWFKKYWQEICVTLLAVGFFVAAVFLINAEQAGGPIKWESPDETANYYFSKLYSETGQLSYFEKLNLSASDIIHPRSVRSDDGQVKPVSFLGLPLIYGFLAKLFSPTILPYLTAFLGALGIFFFYLLVRKIFGRANAFLCAFLLASFPPYFYYSVRAFFHNIPFVVFLIVGLYFLVLAGEKKSLKRKFISWKLSHDSWRNLFFPAIGGVMIGLALLTRASEALWLIPALLIVWVFNFKKFSLLKVLIFIIFVFLAFSPQLYWNKVLYGGFFQGGYAEMNQSINSIASTSSGLAKNISQGRVSLVPEYFKQIKDNIFHFGFHPKGAWNNFKLYFVNMFPWLFWPLLLGSILFLMNIRNWKRGHWAFLLAWVISGIILVLYYGSWNFHDSVGIAGPTLGDSYTRYWLPLYLGALPIISFFILRFTGALFISEKEDFLIKINKPKRFFSFNFLTKNFLLNIFRAIFIIFIFYFSATLIFGAQGGLASSFSNRQTSLNEYQDILNLTPENSVIITRYQDKLIFPERKVIVGAFDDPILNNLYARLLKEVPLYYYNFSFNNKDLEYINKKLLSFGFKLELVKKSSSGFALYKLISVL